MRTIHDRGAGPKALMTLTLWLACAAAAAAGGEPLTLQEAQQIALARDAGRTALEGESSAMRELAVAAGQLPDPEARLGAVNVPTDSFALGAEDMTMLEVGLMQRFPAGRSRALSRSRYETGALGLDADASERARGTRLEVERAWRELDYLDQALSLLARQATWAQALVAGAEAAYAAGDGTQTELLDARLMALEIEERRIDAERDRDLASATLARWIGDAASGPRQQAPPAPRGVEPIDTLLARLKLNPVLQSLEHAREGATLEADLARERYKPSFGVDVAYGFRQGAGMTGGSRPDMLTAMLTFDLPLFTRNRQDREAGAARARARAAESRRDDAARDLEARLRSAHARALRLEDVIALYESGVARLADVSVEAALASYRSSEGSLATVVATQRRVLDVRERLARALTDHAIAAAEIAYLAGDPS
jgi:outer membrane protein TolC